MKKRTYLSKSLRNKIYREALRYYMKEVTEARSFSGTPWIGLCFSLWEASKSFDISINPYNEIHRFQEIYRHKPSNTSEYWWPQADTGVRIRVLKQAIEETN